ncbi:hypothetical protein BKA66DRAFT_450131 [Pyrenochaeta sp. MPI-SDFR-AT-0127]|nr:hypothetical protein BKA66DRAFT_450131 [Pyrenochaeta sp. MPI-SDFR-AT-0127]
MARFRVWLRDHVLNRLRDPQRKNTRQQNSFRKSIMISAPIPLGSVTFDVVTPSPPLPGSLSAQDLTEPHPLRYSRRMSADFQIPQSIAMIIEDEEPSDDESRPHTPPPTLLPVTSLYSEPATITESPTRRPTKNFSRRFSSRFSAFSSHSISSNGSNEGRRMSQMSTVSAMSKAEFRDEWEENRLSRRWSNRMSGALENHTKNYTPIGVI